MHQDSKGHWHCYPFSALILSLEFPSELYSFSPFILIRIFFFLKTSSRSFSSFLTLQTPKRLPSIPFAHLRRLPLKSSMIAIHFICLCKPQRHYHSSFFCPKAFAPSKFKPLKYGLSTPLFSLTTFTPNCPKCVDDNLFRSHTLNPFDYTFFSTLFKLSKD